MKRALAVTGFHSVLLPVGLNRDDRRWLDGTTVFPFRQGKALVWDATGTGTIAKSDLFTSATNPGSACIAAEVRKRLKYANLTQDYTFVPVVIETEGLIGHEIGRKISRGRQPLSVDFLNKMPLFGHRLRKCDLNHHLCQILLVQTHFSKIVSFMRIICSPLYVI